MNLSDRMKRYEQPTDLYLVKRMPAIIRIDGKAFHIFTRGFSPQYDKFFRRMMEETTLKLCKNIQCARLGYSQSDEISILLIDYNKFNTDQFFDGRIQKIVSIAASMTTTYFNQIIDNIIKEERSNWNRISEFLIDKIHKAMFDVRVFNIPREDVENYFIWRQQDAVRNSILSLGYKYFSHKDLLNLSCDQVQEKLFSEKEINWNNCSIKLKHGFAVAKHSIGWKIDLDIPEFSKERGYVELLVNHMEEGE